MTCSEIIYLIIASAIRSEVSLRDNEPKKPYSSLNCTFDTMKPSLHTLTFPPTKDSFEGMIILQEKTSTPLFWIEKTPFFTDRTWENCILCHLFSVMEFTTTSVCSFPLEIIWTWREVPTAVTSINEPVEGVKSGDSIRKRMHRPLPAAMEQREVRQKVSVMI